MLAAALSGVIAGSQGPEERHSGGPQSSIPKGVWLRPRGKREGSGTTATRVRARIMQLEVVLAGRDVLQKSAGDA